ATRVAWGCPEAGRGGDGWREAAAEGDKGGVGVTRGEMGRGWVARGGQRCVGGRDGVDVGKGSCEGDKRRRRAGLGGLRPRGACGWRARWMSATGAAEERLRWRPDDERRGARRTATAARRVGGEEASRGAVRPREASGR
ncbi:hypothetical protein K439DRAFT_827481, partial [Ramaria rubella]